MSKQKLDIRLAVLQKAKDGLLKPHGIQMPEWEDLCNRCGLCCFEKWVDHNGRVHATPIPCRYLDIVDRTCKVYHKRFTVGEGCVKLTPEVVRSVNWLPEECAYVIHMRKINPE